MALQRGTKVWDRQALSHSSISGTATAHVKSSNTATVASAALTAFFGAKYRYASVALVVLEAPYSCRKRPSISAVITFGELEPWTD